MRHERRRKIRRAQRKAGGQRALKVRRQFAEQHRIFFDRDLTRSQIVLPSIMSLTINHDETVAALRSIRTTVLEKGQAVMLHFNALQHMEPAAALALVAEIHRLQGLRGYFAVHGTYPSSQDIYELLKEMGFFSLLKIHERTDIKPLEYKSERPIYLRFLSDTKVQPEIVDRFVGIVEKHIVDLSPLARTRLVAAIGEAISNTLDHAHPEGLPVSGARNRWWLSAAVRPKDHEVTIMLFDQGVGIPNTLKPNIYEEIRAAIKNLARLRLSSQPTDGEMIAAATEYHRSGVGGERGRGFDDMKRFVDSCQDGELRVLSNRGVYHYVGGKDGLEDFSGSLDGTLIEWRFRHDGKLDMTDD